MNNEVLLSTKNPGAKMNVIMLMIGIFVFLEFILYSAEYDTVLEMSFSDMSVIELIFLIFPFAASFGAAYICKTQYPHKFSLSYIDFYSDHVEGMTTSGNDFNIYYRNIDNVEYTTAKSEINGMIIITARNTEYKVFLLPRYYSPAKHYFEQK